jgi:exo-1,4-beta-D-glucosaminidase
MGLWREVYLTASGPVRLRYPTVITHFADDSLQRADLTVRAELANDTDAPVAGTLRGGFDGVTFSKEVTLAPGEHRPVILTPDEFPQLRIAQPAVWWPAGWGEQPLHRLSMTFESGGSTSDAQGCTFGIREITSELHGTAPRPGGVFNNNGDFNRIVTDERPLLLRVNRRPILIRGGGWCPDMLMRSSPERIRAEFRYLLDMHLNAIRLEGKLESDAFFDLADRMGILILAGWCCGDIWERWSSWKPNDYTIAYESQRTQILRLRHHASMALWMNGSDNPPPPEVETTYLKILADNGWPNPSVSSATSVPTTVSGPTGVKMTGPYDHVPPSYWLTDTEHFGGAFGFNTETSPGAAIPDLGSLKKFLPAEKLWPVNELWNLHAGAGSLNNNITHFSEAMNAIYGAPAGLDDFLRKSQAMCYDGQRAMFEAYARNKHQSTGVIQWMLNNGWPSVMWHLYDYYLQPAAGYFGTKKACEPLHIQYSYDDRSVVVVNSLIRDCPGLTAEASLLDFNLRPLFTRTVRLDSPADSVQRIVTLPEVPTATGVTFVRLALTDATGRVVSSNFYWLPRHLPTFDWSQEQAKAHPYYTAVTRYEDLTLLNQLPEVRPAATASARNGTEGREVSVTVRNPTDHLAFQVHLAVVGAESREEILPVLWDDNYFALMPGESRTVVARHDPVAGTGNLTLIVDGWNIAPQSVPVTEADASGHETASTNHSSNQ